MVLRRLLLLTLPMRLALLVAWSTLPATAVKDVHSENDCRCWAAQGACASNSKFMVPNCAASCERHQACNGLFEAGGPSVLEERKVRITELEDQLARGSGEQQQQLQQKDARISELEEELAKSAGERQELKASNAQLEEQLAGGAGEQQQQQQQQEKIAQLEGQLAQSAAERQVLQEKESQVAQLEKELTKAAGDRQELKEKDMKIMQLEERLKSDAATQQQLEEKDARIAQLEDALNNNELAKAAGDRERDTKIMQLEERLKSSAATKQQLEQKDARIVQLEDALTNSATSKEQLKEKDARIAELSGQIANSAAIEQQLQEKNTQIMQFEEQLATNSAALQQLKEKDATIVRLKAAITELNNTHAKVQELQAQCNAQGADNSERVAILERALEQTEAKNKELQVSLGEAKQQAAGASASFAKLEATAAQGAEKSKLTEAKAKEREEQHQQELSKAMADAASAEARAAELEAGSLQREQDAAAKARQEMESDLKRARAALEDLHVKQRAQSQEIQICVAKTQQLEQKVELSEHKQSVESLKSNEAMVPGGTEQATLECLNAKQACEDKTQVLEAQVAHLRLSSRRAAEDPPSPLEKAAAATASEAAAAAAAGKGQNCVGASCRSRFTEQAQQMVIETLQDLRQKIATHGGDAKERATAAWVEMQKSASDAFARVRRKLEPHTRRCSARLVALIGRILSRLERFSPQLDRVSLHFEAVRAAAFAAGYPGSIALLLFTTGLTTYIVWRLLFRLFLFVMAIAWWTLGCITCCCRRSCSFLCCCCCRTCCRRCKWPWQAEGESKSRKLNGPEQFFIGQQDDDAEPIAEPLHEPPPSAGNNMKAAPPIGSSGLGAVNVLRPPPAGIGPPRVKAVAAAWPPPCGGTTPPSPPLPAPGSSPRQPSTVTDGTPREFRALDMHLEETVLNRVEGRLERIEGKLGTLMELCSKVPESATPMASADMHAPLVGDMY